MIVVMLLMLPVAIVQTIDLVLLCRQDGHAVITAILAILCT